MPDYSHAFQPLLRPLDDYAIQILEKRLRPRIPMDSLEVHDYFSPYLGDMPARDRAVLEKNQRYLRDNLVFGRSIQKLGTLLFCLDYSRTGAKGPGGVWRDAQEAFSGQEIESLRADLKEVNAFRNTRVAHVENKLDDPKEAWQAMVTWFRCLGRMSEIAS